MKSQHAHGQSALLRLLRFARFKSPGCESADIPSAESEPAPKPTATPETATPEAATPGLAVAPARLSPLNREYLLKLARRALTSVVTTDTVPQIDPAALEPILTEGRACFVTLTRRGELRGCVGHVTPQLPLCEAIVHNARRAATLDPRFAPVEPAEVERLKIEISVLTDPQPLHFGSPAELLEQLRPHRDGVLVRVGSRRATFLPKVWETFTDKTEFLNHLCQKAGCDPDAWRGPEAEVFTYTAEVFAEEA